MPLTVTEGTQTDVYSVANAGTEIPIVKLDIGSGTAVADFGGTITRVNTIGTLGLGSVTVTSMPSGGTISTNQLTGTINTGTLQNLVSGTINALAAGTITGGTIQNLNAGTIQRNMTPTIIGTSSHTRGTTGAAVWGTLVAAAGAGTRQYVSGLAVVVTSGTVDIAATNIGIGGSTGAGVLARGQFTPGGGIQREFDPVAASATNGTLAFWMGGAGTVDITVDYWQGV